MHTQDFIKDMKAKLEEERAQILDEFKDDSHMTDGEVQANFPDYGRSEEDNVTEMEEYQSLAAITATSKQRLIEIEDALGRIEAGKYGLTDEGQEIPEARLRANPAATTLVV